MTHKTKALSAAIVAAGLTLSSSGALGAQEEFSSAMNVWRGDYKCETETDFSQDEDLMRSDAMSVMLDAVEGVWRHTTADGRSYQILIYTSGELPVLFSDTAGEWGAKYTLRTPSEKAKAASGKNSQGLSEVSSLMIATQISNAESQLALLGDSYTEEEKKRLRMEMRLDLFNWPKILIFDDLDETNAIVFFHAAGSLDHFDKLNQIRVLESDDDSFYISLDGEDLDFVRNLHRQEKKLFDSLIPKLKEHQCI